MSETPVFLSSPTTCLLQNENVCLQGLFIGIGEMRGLGLQHLHGMGFLMGRIMGDDGRPVWSGPSYLEIASSRSGVGAGENYMLTICKTCIFLSAGKESQ